jgi:hypothetical protein
MRSFCFWTSVAHCLSTQSVLNSQISFNGHLSNAVILFLALCSTLPVKTICPIQPPVAGPQGDCLWQIWLYFMWPIRLDNLTILFFVLVLQGLLFLLLTHAISCLLLLFIDRLTGILFYILLLFSYRLCAQCIWWRTCLVTKCGNSPFLFSTCPVQNSLKSAVIVRFFSVSFFAGSFDHLILRTVLLFAQVLLFVCFFTSLQ